MAYVPIFLDVTGRRGLVIGGGEVAARKVATLLDAGAMVTVVSPLLIDALALLVREGRIDYLARAYAPGDMSGAMLVYAATDDPELHLRLHAEAGARGIPLNVADEPALCSFIAPAILTRGALQIAVSTGGASPALAKRIVQRLERLFGHEYAPALEVMRAARRHLKSDEPNIKLRAKKLTALAASGIPEYLRKGNLEGVEKVLRRELGVGLDALGLSNIRSRAFGSGDEATPTVR
jgi:precorrin-2 dehydrogenase / sirohydrochlorin ferrochelatase